MKKGEGGRPPGDRDTSWTTTGTQPHHHIRHPKIRALEISGENLEDLLAYDDLFLDYFNAFLSLPVFPEQMAYNRLTGAFDELELESARTASSRSSMNNTGIHYGVTDEERDEMLVWARRERLPLFLSTQLFREFKLCKLLLRPLDDRYSASRGSSRQIRGYSRQSESYVSSLSNSADNSANDAIDDDDDLVEGHFNPSSLYRYQRPGSRALSVPAQLYYGFDPFFHQRGSTATETQQTSPEKTPSARNRSRRGGTEDSEVIPAKQQREGRHSEHHRESIVTFDPTADRKSFLTKSKSIKSKKKAGPTSDVEEAFLRHARVLSAPINYEDFMRQPIFGDYDLMFGEAEPEPNGQVYVDFEDDGTSEAQTETDVKNLEGRVKMSIQQMKEQQLGNFHGMEGFKGFLAGTAGSHLINFWLDCEYFKDSMESLDEETTNEKRNRLFRDIQDKYKMNLTKDAKEQLAKAASNSNLSHTIFIRTQYDVLRRLRAYWVPRYLLHQEHLQKLSPYSTEVMEPEVGVTRWIPMGQHKSTLTLFPSISLVNSMPVKPDDVLAYSQTKNWELVSKGGRKLDDRITSAKYRREPQISAFSGILGFSSAPRERSNKERFIIALSADKMAGGPFERYLEKIGDMTLLSNLLFWQDVTEYGAAEDRSADRLLRLCNAWAIFNKYISGNSPYDINVPSQSRETIHKSLLTARDFVEASIFNGAKYHAVDMLENVWIRYLKEDLKTFLDCRIRPGIDSPPSTADAIEITITNDDILISRPRPWRKERDHQRSLKNTEVTQSTKTGPSVPQGCDSSVTYEYDTYDPNVPFDPNLVNKTFDKRYRSRRPSVRNTEESWSSASALSFTFGTKVPFDQKMLNSAIHSSTIQSRRPPTSDSEKARRLAMAVFDDMDSVQRAELRAKRREARKEMERERRKAIRAAYKRVREAKQKKGEKKEGEGEMEEDEFGDKKSARPAPPFQEMTGNKVIMQSFKKHLQESEDKEPLHQYSLFMDIETFLSFGSNKKETQRKENFASIIQKTYLDTNAKKKVALSDKISGKISSEKERPKTPLMKEIQHHIHHKIDEQFKAYVMMKSDEQGLEPGELVKLSQAELTLRLGNDGGPGAGAWRRKGRGKDDEEEDDNRKGKKSKVMNLESEHTYPSITVTITEEDPEYIKKMGRRRVRFAKEKEKTQTSIKTEQSEYSQYTDYSQSSSQSQGDSSRDTSSGQGPQHRRRMRLYKSWRAKPSREDKEEFQKALRVSAAGHLDLQMLHFYKYLLKHGEEDNMPLIDKDLFFYIECQKFKDCSHAFADEELLRKKVQSIIDCFLESVTNPPLQVDLTSDIHQKCLRAAQRYLGGKDVFPSIFDEGMLCVYNVLLPYWAGFRKSYSPPDDPTKRPITKYQKLLKKRLDNIENYVIPSNEFCLPTIPEGSLAAYTFSLAEGVKLRDYLTSEENMLQMPLDKDSSTRSSRMDMSRGRRPSIMSITSKPPVSGPLSGPNGARRGSITAR